MELRLDAFDDGELDVLASLVTDLQETGVPCVVTLRAADEGGKTELSDEDRFARLAQLADACAPAWIDVEWRPMVRAGGWPMAFLDLASAGGVGRPADAKPTRFLASAHDFDGRPKDLLNLAADIAQSRADAVKLAWRARSVRDNVEAFELLREAAKPTVALCMGEAGLPSRVLARKFGGYLSFASLDDEAATADGQVPVAEMKRLYRWDAIGRSTKVYGVVAHPVAHSRSPHVHNAAFEAAEHDGVYLPLLVQPGYESFKAFAETWLRFAPLDVVGLSVTLPHKENALRYAREVGGKIDELAEAVGAVNTLRIERPADDEGTIELTATNTDFDAMLDTACDALGCSRQDLRGQSVGVLGAGGTGRTAVAAFGSVGCNVTVYNRTRNRAAELVDQFDSLAGTELTSAALSDAASASHRIWINTTSVGLAPDLGASPFGDAPPPVGPGDLVFDTIYAPPQTRLLRDAAAAGAATVNGEAMFIRQAAAQFELWTGSDAPLEVMRQAFRDGLSGA